MTGGAADTPFNAATTDPLTPLVRFSYPFGATARRGNNRLVGIAILIYFAFSTLLPSFPTPLSSGIQVRLETRMLLRRRIVLCSAK